MCLFTTLLLLLPAASFALCMSTGSQPPVTAQDMWKSVKEAIETAIFEQIDKNSDGWVDRCEMEKEVFALGGKHLDTKDEISRGVRRAMRTLDHDHDKRILESELYSVKRPGTESLLNPSGVADWVRYAVRLPQYAKAFEDNNINWLDFSVLMQDDGRALETEIGIEDRSHRQRLTKLMKIVMLGIGEAPLQPGHSCLLATCNGLHLKWKANAAEQLFPVQLFNLQMRAAGDDDEDAWQPLYHGPKSYYEVKELKANTQYRFRVQAWNQVGHSPFTELNCTTMKSCSCKSAVEDQPVSTSFGCLWCFLRWSIFVRALMFGLGLYCSQKHSTSLAIGTCIGIFLAACGVSTSFGCLWCFLRWSMFASALMVGSLFLQSARHVSCARYI